ncbi:MAG: hypothetical protein KDE31_04985, partial [Caldilineaceae bacterium]|nr:hypothetical protein [Caldilineaceae bacterium]
GPVDIYNNLIQNNMANDDGGGLRFLMAGNFPMNVYNNMIVDNVSTHEGGGIGLNDAPNVRIYNNTIMKNLTTATAVTSLGFPAPAGLSTSANSDQLQATLPGGSPSFSNPLLFNNIFWDNRAGTRSGGTVTGLGATGDPTPINRWDLGVADGTGVLASTNSILQSGDGAPMGADPQVVSAYDVAVTFAAWRNNPAFVDAIMVVNDLPPNLLGDYHLQSTSPAINLGAAGQSGVNAPTFDIDNQSRTGNPDSGADEYGAGTPPPPPPSTTQLYLTLAGNVTLPGISGTVTNDDIVSFDGTNYSMVFDASDVLPANVTNGASVNGFELVNDTTVLLSFSSGVNISGIAGTVDDSDIVQFTGTLGDNTAGTFSMYFDGSDVSLTTAAEAINAFDLLSDGSLVISTAAGVSVPGISGSTTGSDLFRCSGGTRGPTTSCTWSWYFDGSDVQLGVGGFGSALAEVINGVGVASNGDIYLSTLGNFNVGVISGNNRDVFVCTAPTTGSATACTYSPTLYFNGSAHGLTQALNPITGIALPLSGAVVQAAQEGVVELTVSDTNLLFVPFVSTATGESAQNTGAEAGAAERDSARPANGELNNRIYLPVVVTQ